jgi:hypothetical protein
VNVFAITVEIALLIYAMTLFVPVKLNATADGLTLKYWRWKVTHFTGTVLSSEALAHTYGRQIKGYTDSGEYVNRSYTTTDIHNTIFLLLPSGQQHEVELVNFGGTAIPGNIITVWYAVLGRKQVSMLMVNNDTDKWSWPDPKRGIAQVITRHVHLAIIAIVFGAAVMIFGGGTGVFLWILSLIVFAAGFRFTRWRFYHGGIKPLVHISRQEAQQLRVATS